MEHFSAIDSNQTNEHEKRGEKKINLWMFQWKCTSDEVQPKFIEVSPVRVSEDTFEKLINVTIIISSKFG